MHRPETIPKKIIRMPIPLDPAMVAAIANSGANIGQNVASGILQGAQNRATRKFAREQYDRQRQDNLADWTMQNEYNSPTSQMARLREAGLNPNLVYGNGAGGLQGATIKSADSPAWNPRVPELDFRGLGDGMMAFLDWKMKKQQIDNLKTANTVALQDAALRAAQTAQTVQSTKSNEFTLSQAQKLSQVSLQTAEAELNKLKADTYVTLQANERAAAQNSQSLAEGAERILTLRLQRAKTDDERNEIKNRIEVLKKDQELRELDLNLKRKGIQPTDALWIRILGQILGGSKVIDLLPK